MIYDHKSINHYFVNLEAYISLVSELEFKKCKIWESKANSIFNNWNKRVS